MTTLVQVPMDRKLVDEMKQLTTIVGMSLEDMMNDMARKYLREVRRKKLALEQEHYVSMHNGLKEQYYGQHVAIYNGELVDHDDDLGALVHRVRERFGHAPVLITQVEEDAMPVYTTHSAQVVSEG